MDKKIIPSIVVVALLLVPTIAMAQSGSVNLEEDLGVVSLPVWLKASLWTWNSEGKYKTTLTNTGTFPIIPDMAAHVFRVGVACPTQGTNLNDWLTAHVGDIDNQWQLKIMDNGNILEDWRPGGNSHSTGTVISGGAVVTWYLYVKSPSGELAAMGDRCLVVEFKDTQTGVLLDWKTDTMTVTTPEGKIALEWLGLTVIGFAGILISKGVGLW